MDIKLKCSCGAVKGLALNVTPDNGNRVVCCCDDCQRFAKHLACEAKTLDQFGGTEYFQTSMAQVRVDKGAGKLRALRLTENGLIRWYTECCNTPVANTVSANFPLASVCHNFMSIKGDRARALGPIVAFVQTQHALGTPTYPHSSPKFPFSFTFRMVRKIVGWKLKKMHLPSAFFDEQAQPVCTPRIVG